MLHKIASWIWDLTCWLVLLTGAVVLALAVVGPRIIGATPYTITTGSMDPIYPPGTLVIVQPTPTEDLKVGDAITYQLESGKPQVVTHRITSVATNMRGEYLFETKGDANEIIDEELVLPAQAKGVVKYSLPFVGYASSSLNGETRWALNYVLAGFLALYSLYMFGSYLRSKFKSDVEQERKARWAWKPLLPRPTTIPLGVVARGAFTLILVVGLLGIVASPSGAYWRSAATLPGTQVTSGSTTPPTPSAYCTVWNTSKNREEAGATCTVDLSSVGCTNFWSTAANVYLRFTTSGVKINGSTNFGNALELRFGLNLQAAGCNPTGVSWAAPTQAGIAVNSSYTVAPSYRCDTLPFFEAKINYYGAGLNSYLGTLYFDKTNASVSCIK